MQVYYNPVSNNTQLTVDGLEMADLNKAMHDEQMFYYSLIRERKYVSPTQKQEWLDKMERLNNLAEAMGANVIKAVTWEEANS